MAYFRFSLTFCVSFFGILNMCIALLVMGHDCLMLPTAGAALMLGKYLLEETIAHTNKREQPNYRVSMDVKLLCVERPIPAAFT